MSTTKQEILKKLFVAGVSIRDRCHKIRCNYRWNSYNRNAQRQLVIETDRAVYVDGKRINHVVKDSVKTELFGDKTIVTPSFFASDFLKC